MTLDHLAGLDLPHLEPNHKLSRILSAALGQSLGRQIPTQFPYWQADFFNFNQVQIFQESLPSEQAQIVTIANQDLLKEAYFIEKAGVGYMARLALLADSTEERMLYGLFAADEATHLAQISPFLCDRSDLSQGNPKPQLPIGSDDPFLQLIADFIQTEDKILLQFVVQVVLEGWGLSHYRSLAQACRDPNLGQCLQHFVRDEARHHGAGLVLFQEAALSSLGRSQAIEVLAQFLFMVQIGPQRLLGAIEQVKGALSVGQRRQILSDLKTETYSHQRLQILLGLMERSGATTIVNCLQEKGCFEAFSIDRCVK